MVKRTTRCIKEVPDAYNITTGRPGIGSIRTIQAEMVYDVPGTNDNEFDEITITGTENMTYDFIPAGQYPAASICYL